ncbi:MAG: hypothetical protein ACI9N9_000324 [Enterobacterales bacterium]|jgi:hypothetical protein
MHVFKNVEEYYLYMSQGNCFAPSFDDLIDKAKQKWIKDFDDYRFNNKER